MIDLSLKEKDIIKGLLDYLDASLESRSCKEDLSLTTDYLRIHAPQIYEHILTWIKQNGGYCDCEVLANIDDIINS